MRKTLFQCWVDIEIVIVLYCLCRVSTRLGTHCPSHHTRRALGSVVGPLHLVGVIQLPIQKDFFVCRFPPLIVPLQQPRHRRCPRSGQTRFPPRQTTLHEFHHQRHQCEGERDHPYPRQLLDVQRLALLPRRYGTLMLRLRRPQLLDQLSVVLHSVEQWDQRLLDALAVVDGYAKVPLDERFSHPCLVAVISTLLQSLQILPGCEGGVAVQTFVRVDGSHVLEDAGASVTVGAVEARLAVSAK
mmetsp:Transcript_60595/g.179628  ORF Transcript_60595/g.179628 Transcript_60595/m.179628 type:complete len:243 (-) Transcript_60595:1715-2443(-)